VNNEYLKLSEAHCKDDITIKTIQGKILSLSAQLSSAWIKDERVRSLNIATQLAGLLSDTSTSSFYPVMFVMVTDELERYGGMLLSRMQNRVEEIAISYQQGAGPSGEFNTRRC
jgi:hypothetical protein